MLDIRGTTVNVGDKVLVTQNKEIKCLSYIKDTEFSYILSDGKSKYILKKFDNSYNWKTRRANNIDLTGAPFKHILKVDDNFIL